jgi:hypothetical protein
MIFSSSVTTPGRCSRFSDGDCTLSLRVGGIDPAEAGRIAGALADHPDVRLSRIEHIVWKAKA